jgi:TolB-like protein/DNA-binding winged helix-turn-helix (wHTH) protein
VKSDLGTGHVPERQEIGTLVLDHAGCQVTIDGRPLTLRPKTFALLCYLAARAGRVVPKRELIDVLWQGVVVTDDSLTQAVSELRGAIGASGPQVIRTVMRRGYLFDAGGLPPAAERGEPEPALLPVIVEPAGRRTRSWRRRALAIGSVFGTATLLVLSVALSERSVAPIQAELTDRRSIAVIPFTDLSDPKAPHVAYAVDHALTRDLGRLDNMRVISRESSAVLGSSETLDPRRVGRELGVRHVVAGTVRQDGDTLSVAVRLLRTDTGALLWSDRFDYPSVADWAAQRNILAGVGNVLNAKVQRSVLERAVLSPASSAAVDHWMRGSYALTTLSTREQLVRARGHFEAALAAQPRSVPALAGLAVTHVREVLYRWSAHPTQSLATGKALARRALAVDPDDQMALLVLAAALNFSGDTEEAMTTTQRVLQLNPNDAAANRELAHSLYFLGRWEDTLRQVDVAERLNPLDSGHMWRLHSTAATTLLALHRYEEAVERARRGAATDPSNLVFLLVAASAEAHRNNPAAAQQLVAQILARDPGYWIGRDRASRGSRAPAYQAGMQHMREGLMLAGMPSGPPPASVESVSGQVPRR